MSDPRQHAEAVLGMAGWGIRDLATEVFVVDGRVLHTTDAWDLIGFDGNWEGETASVRVKGGRTLYEAVMFIDGGRATKPRLARLEATADGIRQVNRYVDPDTVCEIVVS